MRILAQPEAGKSKKHTEWRSLPWQLLGLALFIRLIFLPFTLHVDPHFVGDIVGFYAYAYRFVFGPIPQWAPLYPPLAYYVGGLYCYLVPGVVPLLSEFYGGSSVAQWVMPTSVFRTLFVLKSLYLFFDLGTGWILWRMSADNPAKRRRILNLWLFNPLVVYNAYLHGQMDIMPILFVVLGLWAAKIRKPRLAVLAFGIGGCFKIYTLLLLLPAVLILGCSWRERLKVSLFGVAPYVLLMLPFLPLYRANIGGYSRFFEGGYDLGFGAQVYIFFIFCAALLWYLYHRKAHTFEDLWRACFAILLVYYQFSYFDLHYWAWIMPFAAIYFAERPREATPFYAIILACLLVLTAPAPLARFLAPISPRFFLRLPSLMEALNPYLPMLFLVNVVRSLLAGTCFYLAWRLLRDMPGSRGDAVSSRSETAAAGGA